MKNIANLCICIIVEIFFFTNFAVAGEKVFFYYTDPAGTPLAMTDSSGNVVWRADNKPFGEEQSITGTAENNKQFIGKEKDKETGLHNVGVRYMKDETGMFISPDPVGPVDSRTSKTNYGMLTNPQRLNSYAYGLNNPYRYIDLDGREVTIIIQRDKYTNTSVTGTISVKSDVTNSTFNGYILENAHAGKRHDKTPIPLGAYDAFVRTDHDPNRVELKDVPGYKNIQIHNGNTVDDAEGCFLSGSTRKENRVDGSRAAMGQINKVIREDGTNDIRVIVNGPSSEPIK